jgi:hypothetical protein
MSPWQSSTEMISHFMALSPVLNAWQVIYVSPLFCMRFSLVLCAFLLGRKLSSFLPRFALISPRQKSLFFLWDFPQVRSAWNVNSLHRISHWVNLTRNLSCFKMVSSNECALSNTHLSSIFYQFPLTHKAQLLPNKWHYSGTTLLVLFEANLDLLYTTLLWPIWGEP